MPPDKLPKQLPSVGRKAPVKLPSKQGLGSMAYSDRELDSEFNQPIDKKQPLVRNTWADTAIVLSLRANKAAQTYGKKDFNALYRLVLSAGIAMDKAFPTSVQPLGGNLIVNLFGSLGSEAARRILEPTYPQLPSGDQVVVDAEVVDPSEKPLEDTTLSENP